MSEVFRWEQAGKTFCSLQQQDKEFLYQLNAKAEKKLRYTVSTNKRKKMQKDTNLALLLNRIGPALL